MPTLRFVSCFSRSLLFKRTCSDTRASSSVLSEQSKGGPGLIYDHQMVADESGERLYVYGGTDVGGRNSGMYRYDIREARWTKLLCVFFLPLWRIALSDVCFSTCLQRRFLAGTSVENRRGLLRC